MTPEQQPFDLSAFAQDVFIQDGFTTRGMLESQLKELGQDPKLAKTITCSISRRFVSVENPLPQLEELPLLQKTITLKAEEGKPEESITVYYNTDLISSEQIDNVYSEYRKSLSSEEEQITSPSRRKQKRQERKAARKKESQETVTPQEVFFGILTYNRTPEEVSPRTFLTKLGEYAPEKPLTIPVPILSLPSELSLGDYSDYQETLAEILKTGISSDRGHTVMRLHQESYRRNAEQRKKIYERITHIFHNTYQEKTQKIKGRNMFLYYAVPQRLAPGVIRVLKEYADTSVKIASEKSVIMSYEEEMLEDWQTRYTPATFAKYREAIFQARREDNKEAIVLSSFFNKENAEDILGSLRVFGQTTILGEEVLSDVLDPGLLPLIFSKEKIMRQWLSDIIIQAFPIGKVELTGGEITSIQTGVRVLVDQFSSEEITSLLITPSPRELQTQLTEAMNRRTLALQKEQKTSKKPSRRAKEKSESEIAGSEVERLRAIVNGQSYYQPGELQQKIQGKVQEKVAQSHDEQTNRILLETYNVLQNK